MTTLHERALSGGDDANNENAFGSEPYSNMKITPDMSTAKSGRDRRVHRRHDMAMQGIPVERFDNKRNAGTSFGQIVDISAGGVRIRTEAADIQADGQIRVRVELPDYAGICPFVDRDGDKLQSKREWIGWMAVKRVSKLEGSMVDVAGQLLDMNEMDRGMLGLYLSTQPLAA